MGKSPSLILGLVTHSCLPVIGLLEGNEALELRAPNCEGAVDSQPMHFNKTGTPEGKELAGLCCPNLCGPQACAVSFALPFAAAWNKGPLCPSGKIPPQRRAPTMLPRFHMSSPIRSTLKVASFSLKISD